MYCILDSITVAAELEVFGTTQSFEMHVLQISLWEFLIAQQSDC